MEFENKHTPDDDVNIDGTIPKHTVQCESEENNNITLKQEPPLYLDAAFPWCSGNTVCSVSAVNKVVLKTEFVDNCDYAETGMQRGPSTNVAFIKQEPADDFSENPDKTECIIEVDTCKDEYYETHGYPSDLVNLNTCNVQHNLQDDLSTNTSIVLEEENNDIIVKQEPIFYTGCGNIVHSGSAFDNVEVKTEFVDNGDYANIDRTHVPSTNVAFIKQEPADDCSKNSDKTECIIEIDTCKDENYETDGYPCDMVNLNKFNIQQDGLGKDTVTTDKHTHTGDTADIAYTCPVCEVGFAYRHSLSYHLRTHIGQEPYTCTVCGAVSIAKHSLLSHLLSHVMEKPHTCTVCGVGFIKKCELQTHSRTHTSTCSICEVSLVSKSNLNCHHIRKHTGEKSYKCSVCGVGFAWKGDLKTHMRIHTGDKPHKCPACAVSFIAKTHTGEKPYKCSVCGVGFKQNCNLKKHTRIHTGEKPHKCPVCEVGFTEKGHLTRHIRTHTREKPYKCSHCGAGFAKKGNMTTHVRIHTGEKPHICLVCEVSFTDRSSLTHHERKHTAEKPNKSST